MQLQELTTYEDKSHLKIVRVHFVIADHADPTKRKEWIEGQISTVLPIVRRLTPAGRSPRASARHTRWDGSGLSASL